MNFLIIDDDKTFRDAASLIIDGAGHYAESAGTGADALAVLKREKFDAGTCWTFIWKRKAD